MRIAVIGSGAMGSIYGGHLSLNNEVCIVDTNPAIVGQINKDGLLIDENGATNVYRPKALTDSSAETEMDLVILFVKAIFSKSALESNKRLIGSNTRLLTLQNGAGHEALLKEYVPVEHVVIGTTEDNGAVLAPGHVRRGGVGRTNVGTLVPDTEGFLPKLKETFDSCGFQVTIHDNIQQMIWAKLFTNVSLSAVTGILQVDMGYIASDEYAWKMTCRLIHEAVAVAAAAGLSFDEDEIIGKVRKTSIDSPNGCTSIRADIRDGRRTEVDTISGAVVQAARWYGVEAPCHEFVVNMVHALEDKNARQG